jgi:flavin-dependent dehydrogenase
MLDVLVAGAGPAGAIAALVLARAGARVLIVDRERFPREKLCGDTLNPGALRTLASLGLAPPESLGRPLAGMILSGPRAAVTARYPDETGLSVRRIDLDAWLLDKAISAGARFEPLLAARSPLIDNSGTRPLVKGLTLARPGVATRRVRIPATMTVAADGRGSPLGRALGLVFHPRRPRRWAFGAYFEGVQGVSPDLGEMHVRHGRYIGIAPVGAGRVNVCLVTGPRPDGRTPLAVIEAAIGADARLRSRFTRAQSVTTVKVLGPLALEARAPGVDGLLLAGDAAGFVDPMTGDGLHLAIRGGLLAAREALRALETGAFVDAVTRLAAARERELGAKLRFNRFVRRFVASPSAVELACLGSKIAPGVFRHAVRYAGDSVTDN